MEPPNEDAAAEEPLSGRSLCPHCGGICEPYQEYCLNCGARLLDTGALASGLGHHLRHLVPRADREWVWPVLISFVVACLAAGSAVVLSRKSSTRTIEALGPKVTRTSMGETGKTGPTSNGSSSTTTTGSASTTTATTRSTSTKTITTGQISTLCGSTTNGVIDWPGPPAYTIVIASIPVSDGAQGACAKARQALGAGLPDVGVLKSSDFSSLHAGYYVVFSGVYGSEQRALAETRKVTAAGMAGSYVKRVVS